MKSVHFYCFYPLKSHFTICLLTAGHSAIDQFQANCDRKSNTFEGSFIRNRMGQRSEFNAI